MVAKEKKTINKYFIAKIIIIFVTNFNPEYVDQQIDVLINNFE